MWRARVKKWYRRTTTNILGVYTKSSRFPQGRPRFLKNSKGDFYRKQWHRKRNVWQKGRKEKERRSAQERTVLMERTNDTPLTGGCEWVGDHCLASPRSPLARATPVAAFPSVYICEIVVARFCAVACSRRAAPIRPCATRSISLPSCVVRAHSRGLVCAQMVA